MMLKYSEEDAHEFKEWLIKYQSGSKNSAHGGKKENSLAVGLRNLKGSITPF